MNIRLHKRQADVLSSLRNDLANEVLYGGAAGGGKSYLLRAIACIFAVECPGVSIYLFRRKVKDLVATHLRGAMSFPFMLSDFINDGLVNINKSNNIIEFENKSNITLAHIQHESDLDNYLSAEIHICLFDEATTFLPKMIRFIRSRVRLGSLEIPEHLKSVLPFIVYGTNPRGPAHHFFKSGWVDAEEPEVVFKAPINDGGMRRKFIPALLKDNPSLTENDPEYANRLMGLGDPDVVKAYLDGDWTVVEGAALPKFSRVSHVKKAIPVPKGWKIKRCYDYGYSAPYSVLFYAISTGESDREFNPVKGSVVIIAEIYGDDGNENGLKEDVAITARKIKTFESEMEWRVFPGPADNSIFSKEQGPSIAETMAGKGISWETSDKTPGSRINGLAECRKLIHNSIALVQEKPGLYVFDTCPRLIQHLSDLQTDDRTGEDVDTTGQPDHDWDVLRYIVLDKSKEIQTVSVEGK
jgi:hypothetical protein